MKMLTVRVLASLSLAMRQRVDGDVFIGETYLSPPNQLHFMKVTAVDRIQSTLTLLKALTLFKIYHYVFRTLKLLLL